MTVERRRRAATAALAALVAAGITAGGVLLDDVRPAGADHENNPPTPGQIWQPVGHQAGQADSHSTPASGYTTASPTGSPPAGETWFHVRHENSWRCNTADNWYIDPVTLESENHGGCSIRDPDTFEETDYNFGDTETSHCELGANQDGCGHSAPPGGQASWTWLGHRDDWTRQRWICDAGSDVAWSYDHHDCGYWDDPTPTTTTTTTAAPPPGPVPVPPPPDPPPDPPPPPPEPPPPPPTVIILNGTFTMRDDYVVVQVGGSVIAHVRENDVGRGRVVVGIIYGSGVGPCGESVRRNNGEDMPDIDYASLVYGACVGAHAPDSEPAQLADVTATDAANARYAAGPIVAVYPDDGWWDTGVVQIVGRTEGRSEFTYCMSLGGEDDCDPADRGTITVDVFPAGPAPVDAVLRPADHEYWIEFRRPTSSNRDGSALFRNYRGYAGPPAVSSITLWNTQNFWRGIGTNGHQFRLGYAEPADMVVFVDADGNAVGETPCADILACNRLYALGRPARWDTSGPPPWTLISPPAYAMRLTFTGTNVLDPALQGTRANWASYQHGQVRIGPTVRFYRPLVDGTVSNDYCMYWSGGYLAGDPEPYRTTCTARDCVRVPISGLNDTLPRQVLDDDRCETGTITITLSNDAPPPLDPPDNLTCTTARGGQVTLSWDAATGAERYRIRRDGDDNNILPLAGWGDLTSTSWLWQTNPGGAMEVASGLLSGIWSAWSSPFDMATCPAPPVLPDMGLCTSSAGTILEWTPPPGTAVVEVLWNPSRGTASIPSGNAQVIPIPDGDTGADIWAWDSSWGLVSQSLSVNLSSLPACAVPPPPLTAPANLLCGTAPDGTVTLVWDADPNAERYRLRLDSDDTQILPAAGQPDLTATTWTWAANPNVTVEAASGVLAGAWSTWSAPLDLAASCPSPPPLNPACVAEIAAPHRLVESAYASDRIMFADLVTLSSVGQGIRERALSANCAGWSWAITAIAPCDTACAAGVWATADANHVTYIADIAARAATLTHDEPADLAAAASCAAEAGCNPGSWSAGARGAYRITATFQPPDYPDPLDPLNTITPPPEVRFDLVWIERRIARQ